MEKDSLTSTKRVDNEKFTSSFNRYWLDLVLFLSLAPFVRECVSGCGYFVLKIKLCIKNGLCVWCTDIIISGGIVSQAIRRAQLSTLN